MASFKRSADLSLDRLARRSTGVELSGDFASDYDSIPEVRALLNAMGRSKSWFVRFAQGAELRGRNPWLAVLSVAIDGDVEATAAKLRSAQDHDTRTRNAAFLRTARSDRRAKN